jgi:hypothetical protein
MTDTMSGSNRRRWLRAAIPVGMAVLAAAGVTAVPALGATAPATPAGPVTSLVAPHRALPGGDRLAGPARSHPH